MDQLHEAARIALAISAICALLAMVWRGSRRPRHAARAAWTRANRAFDVVLGTPAVVDPDTGQVVIPERPDIGVRVGSIETVVQRLSQSSAEDSRAAARAAAESAAAARAAAQAAQAIAEATSDQVRAVQAEVRSLAERVDTWQGVDRVQAETATAALHELGVDMELPRPTRADAS